MASDSGSTLAIVVPSNRPEQLGRFLESWQPLIEKHQAGLITVLDGDVPRVRYDQWEAPAFACVPGVEKFLCTGTDSVRNIGFLVAKKLMRDLKVIITLDDDVFPDGNDPIQEHLDALAMRVPISWFSTASEYMRGFPYGIRSEAEVWVSHGVWTGVHDYDAPTQLVTGMRPATFYRGPVPRGALTPVSGMNLAFRVEALPHVYFAPMGERVGYGRFGDIWMGIGLVRALDAAGAALVSGYSTVRHMRASNVFRNLAQEATGLGFNERFWMGDAEPGMEQDYLALYELSKRAWEGALQWVCRQAA